MRWLATLIIAGLFALDLILPGTDIGRRGHEALARADVRDAVGKVGEQLPDLALQDLRGQRVSLDDLRGHPTLLIFERSVDW
jgi:cytochrome oxidase Cu insertion factor (SCO1/SenC/PrrC family)